MQNALRRKIVLNTACHKTLRIAGTVNDSIVDGPGIRYVIFTQGCPHHCEGCHNPETHDFEAGKPADINQILEEIFRNPMLSGVTFSGGEPFCQPEALLPIAEAVKEKNLHLMIFTGYLLEKLQEMKNEAVQRLLQLADIIVDGPFILAEKNLTLSFRGSENQRVIDMVKTRKSGEVVLYKSEYEFLW